QLYQLNDLMQWTSDTRFYFEYSQFITKHKQKVIFDKNSSELIKIKTENKKFLENIGKLISKCITQVADNDLYAQFNIDLYFNGKLGFQINKGMGKKYLRLAAENGYKDN
ncbi:3386_t:CDS:2, partial [Gigaspora margarita]